MSYIKSKRRASGSSRSRSRGKRTRRSPIKFGVMSSLESARAAYISGFRGKKYADHLKHLANVK